MGNVRRYPSKGRGKNAIIKRVGKDKAIEVCDIANIMKKSKYRHIDTNHFEKRDFSAIVEEYSKYVKL